MKIILLSCPTGKATKYRESYPLGVAYLGAALEEAGHEVLAFDYYADGWDKASRQIESLIAQEEPELLGLSILTLNRINSFQVAKMAKEINPSIKVVAGGPHASPLYKQVLENYSMDVVVIGEGEDTMRELAQALEKKEELARVKGIALKANGQVITTGLRPFVQDLDSLPFPRHEYFAHDIREKGVAYMITTRGCPIGCSFCSVSHYWGRSYRERSADNVIAEMESLMKSYPGIKHIMFHDDVFTMDQKRVIEICRKIIKHNFSVEWSCQTRVNSISEELLGWMEAARCRRLYLGIESGSPQILASIDKKTKIHHIERAYALLEKFKKIEPCAYLMVGNPGESEETVNETIELLKRINIGNYNRPGLLQLYPQTPVYELAKKNGFINDDFWLTDEPVPIYTYEHPREKLEEWAARIAFALYRKRGLGFLIKSAFRFLTRHSWEETWSVFKYLLRSFLRRGARRTNR